MGGLAQQLFGGSSNKSMSTATSGNNAFGMLSEKLGGNIDTGNSAMSAIASALGLGGGDGSEGVKNFMSSAGYNNMLDTGSRAITGSAAARGLLKSGSTLKGLTTFGQNLGQQGFTNYLGQLGSLMQGGAQSAGLISGAGGFSNSQSTSKGSSSAGILPVLFG